MLTTRVMPCLLLKNRSLVKTTLFESPSYVGDPINTVRIFNEFEVDELFTFYDLAKLMGYRDIVLSDGASWAHRVLLAGE